MIWYYITVKIHFPDFHEKYSPVQNTVIFVKMVKMLTCRGFLTQLNLHIPNVHREEEKHALMLSVGASVVYMNMLGS